MKQDQLFNTSFIVYYCVCPLFVSPPGVLTSLDPFWTFFFLFSIRVTKCSLILLWFSFEHFESSWPLCVAAFHTLTPPPCSVLVSSRHSGLEAALPRSRGQLWGRGNKMVKMAVWGLSATLGAAVFAVAQTAMDWGPEVLLQLFWCGGGDLDCKTLTYGDSRHRSALQMD